MTITGLTNISVQESLRAQQNHQANVSDAISQLSTGLKSTKASKAPSDQAIATQLDSLTRVLTQANVNAKNAASVIQVATGAINNIQTILSTMDALAAKSNSQDIDASTRSQINEEYETLRDQITTIAERTRWNGVALLTGGAGKVDTAAAITQAGTVVASTVAGIAADINAATQGTINGVAQSVSVAQNGSKYDLTLTISHQGNEQTFKAEGVTVANDAVIQFISTTNSRNIIAIDFAADTSGITDVDTFTTALKESMGLTAGVTAAQFTSETTAANGGVVTISAASNTAPGFYTLIKDAGENSPIILQDVTGRQWTATAATTAAAQTINFDNGVSVALDNTYDAANAITQMGFDVEEGTSVTMSFQVGELSTDMTQAIFNGATGKALKIEASDINSMANAAASSTLIKAAQKSLSQMYAQLGAQQTNLESIQENLSVITENLNAAKANYRDADIAAAIADQVMAAAMVDLAGIAQAKALAQQQQPVKLAQSV
jgi:flagellin